MKKNRKSRRNGKTLAAVVLLALVLGLGGYYYAGQDESEGGISSRKVVGGETRAVRWPARFPSFRAHTAYLAAQRYPQVMDKVYCYCGCDRPPVNHKSLLSCFTDHHALN